MKEVINNLNDLKKKHYDETEKFIRECPHTSIDIEDHNIGYQREITLRCKRCQLNMLTYITSSNWSFLSYIQACANGHPDSLTRKIGNLTRGEEEEVLKMRRGKKLEDLK